MTVRKRNDEKGWSRGEGHYSREHAKLTHPRHIPPVQSIDAKTKSQNKTGPVSSSGPPRHKPKSGPISNGGGATMA